LGEGCLLLRGREGNGKREERGWEGEGKRREGTGKDDLHLTLFRPCPLCPWTPLGAPPPVPHHSEEIAATAVLREDA